MVRVGVWGPHRATAFERTDGADGVREPPKTTIDSPPLFVLHHTVEPYLRNPR